jgi:transposase
MDAHTEQAYQQRIVKLELQNTSLEACVSDLTRQLAERNEQLTQRDATIAALQQQVAELSKQVTDLLAQVARLSKNSSNSSKPPSSDIVKPPLPPVPPGEKRSVGGQKGHPHHEREPFTPDQINRVVDYRLNRCPNCGGRVRPLNGPPRKVQLNFPLAVTKSLDFRPFRRHILATFSPMPRRAAGQRVPANPVYSICR